MSRTKAINDYCKGCIYDKAAPGSWRAQVEACTSEHRCPLWPYRPITIETINANRKAGKGAAVEADEDVAEES